MSGGDGGDGGSVDADDQFTDRDESSPPLRLSIVRRALASARLCGSCRRVGDGAPHEARAVRAPCRRRYD